MSKLSFDHRLMPVGREPLVGKFLSIVVTVTALGIWGGAPRAGMAAEVPSPSPSINEVTAEQAPPAPDVTATSRSAQPDMAILVDSAKRLHPTARAIHAAQRAADARLAAAGVWANPAIDISYGHTRPRVADLSSDRPYEVTLSQRFEWWGKRRARVAAAQADVTSTRALAEAEVLDLEVEVRLAAISYTIARETALQAAAQASLARELLEVVMKRQAVGDIDLGAAARVKVEASTARLRHEAATRAVATSLSVLRTWCGETLPDDLVITNALDLIASDVAEITSHPRLRAALEAERAAESRTEAERQARYPDVTIGVFGGREQEKDTVGVTLGIEIPLWNRNAAGIAAAQADSDRLAATRQLEALRLRRELTEAIGAIQLAKAEIATFTEEALPAASDAVRLRGTAFTTGDVSLSEVLDARRALISVQTDLIDAKRRLAEAQVRLLASTAVPVSRP